MAQPAAVHSEPPIADTNRHLSRRQSPQHRHGTDALIEAARMIDQMLEQGDPDGRIIWYESAARAYRL
jgi:hypothetical protein